MAKAPKNSIPIEAVKVDRRLEFVLELMSANPSENRSETHKMLMQMVFDKASKRDADKVVSKNAGSKGGKISVEQKRKSTKKRDAEIVKKAEDLKKTKGSREIAGILAERFGLSPTTIRSKLKKQK
jgi:hypothetical protein